MPRGRPVFPVDGPGWRELSPAILLAGAPSGLGLALVCAGTLPRGQLIALGVATSLVNCALLLELAVTRMNQRVPTPKWLLLRIVVAAAAPSISVIAIGTVAFWPLRDALLAGSAVWFGALLGERDLRNRLGSAAVSPARGAAAGVVVWLSRLLLRSAPEWETRSWLQINLIRGLARRSDWLADPQALAEARSAALDLISPTSRTRGQGELLTAMIIHISDVARAWDLTTFGTPDTGGRMLDELIAWGRDLFGSSPPAPDVAVSRLRYIEAERVFGKLTQRLIGSDALTASQLVDHARDVRREAHRLAREALRYAASPAQRSDAWVIVVQAAHFAAFDAATEEAWTGVLDEARSALAELAPDSPDRVSVITVEAAALKELAAVTMDDAARLGQLQDSADALLAALSSTPPPTDDERMELRYELGQVRIDQAVITGDLQTADDGMRYLVEAARGASSWLDAGRVATRMGSAVRFELPPDEPDERHGRYLRSWRREVAESCRHAVDVALVAARSGVVRAERQNPLRMMEVVTLQGAEFWLELNEPLAAVELLERGRLIVVGATLDAETRHEQLMRSGRSDLANRWRAEQLRLESLEGQLGDPIPDRAARVQLAGEAQRARDELRELTAQVIRATSSAAPMAAGEAVQRASQRVSLLYLTAGDVSGHAVLLRDGVVILRVRLPDLILIGPEDGSDAGTMGTGLQAQVNRYQRAQTDMDGGGWRPVLDDVLEWLDAAVAAPLRQGLSGIDEVALIACGPLAQLPVHAVLGRRPDGGTRVVRYAAGARVLAERSQDVERRGDRPPASVLTVSVPATGASLVEHLRTADEQADAAAAAFPSSGRFALRGEEATCAEVLRRLPLVDVAHFSCHGRAEARNPLDSGLLLLDGRLTVREILQVPGMSLRLAVVSACEGSLPGADLQDELNSLATGLLEAGVAGVVAAMWRVPERASYYLCRELYAQLPVSPTPAAAFTRAQSWLRTATRADLARHPPPPGYRARVLHAGPSADDRPFANADSWACFAYYGV